MVFDGVIQKKTKGGLLFETQSILISTCTFVTNYPRLLCRSAWLGFLSQSVCLFVRSITQKRMIPKCSDLVYWMTLRYPRSCTVLGFKGQGHRVSNTTQ